MPRPLIVGLAFFGYGPPFVTLILIAVVVRSWLFGIVGCLGVLLSAWWAVSFLSRIRIVVDSERIRWPLWNKELRWQDVQRSEIVRVLGFQYVRVVAKDNRKTWIALNEPGGGEYRKRVLGQLGLG